MSLMVTMKAGDDVTWTVIGPDGSDTQAFGVLWAPAAPLAGMAAWWAVEGTETGAPGRGPAVLVCRASRRHRAGREVSREVLGSIRSRYAEKAGRYVDAGEWFRESDARSRFARPYVPPTHITLARPDAAAQTEMTLFATLCERSERGEDVDMSVSARSAADAAERSEVDGER